MRRLLCFAPEALGRSGRVYIYLYVGAELLQLVRVVSGYVTVRGLSPRPARASRLKVPGRGGAWEGYGDTPALPAQLASVVQCPVCRHLHGHLPGVALRDRLGASFLYYLSPGAKMKPPNFSNF